MARDEKIGIVKLSLIPNGSCNSVKVAASAPANAGYSRSSTERKTVQAIRKQTVNMATDPSRDFLPQRPNLTEQVSPPNDTPIMAADMSPRTRNRMDTIAIDGGLKAIVSVHPREKKQPPVSCDFSWARNSLASGQFLATTPPGK